MLRDRACEFGVAGEADLDLCARTELGAQAVERDDVVRLRHGHDQRRAARVVAQRQQAVTAGEGVGDAAQRLGVGQRGVEVDLAHAAVGGECLAQGAFADEAELDEHAPERALAQGLFVQRDAQLVGADQSGVQQLLAEREGRVHGCSAGAASCSAAAGSSSGRSGMCGKLRWPGEGAPARKSASGRWGV